MYFNSAGTKKFNCDTNHLNWLRHVASVDLFAHVWTNHKSQMKYLEIFSLSRSTFKFENKAIDIY